MKNQSTGIAAQAQPLPAGRRPLMSGLLVIGAYFLLTIAMTWPAARYLTTAIPGDGFDGWQNYWNLWWVRKALLELGTDPFFTHYLYAPNGVSLLFHTLNIFNGLWTLPVQLNLGLAVAYHSVVFFSFVFAGFGGYLLCLYTLAQLGLAQSTGLRPAAFIGGLVFTLSPFHLAHLLGHMQVFSMAWPPFYVLWLLRTLQPWAAPATGPITAHQWRNVFIAILFLVLASLVDWYHTLYLLIFTGLVLLWLAPGRWRVLTTKASSQRRMIAEQSPLFFRSARPPGLKSLFSQPLLQPLWLVLAIGLGFGVILSPLLIPMIREASSRPDLQTGLVQNVTLSADLLAFVLPSEMHPVWGRWAKSIAANFSSTTSERLIFAGYVPLALGLYLFIRGHGRQPIIRFWGLVTAIFVLLALGPYLHVGGELVTIAGQRVPLPYLLLYHIVPFIGLTRSLSRYDLMVMLGLGVLAGVAAYRLTTGNDKLASLRLAGQPLLPYLAALLICFEFLTVPYPISTIEVPAFYQELSAQTDNYTIAELPMNWDRPTPLLHQTVHNKALLTAYTSRDNPLELAWRTPVFQHWRYLSPDIIDQPLALIAPTIFFDFNLRYIVLDYWQMPPGPERAGTERWVATALPQATPVYDDGRLKVYQSPPKESTQPYLTLGEGWSPRQEHAGGPLTRSFSTPGSQPELFLNHPQNQRLTLELTAAAQPGLHLVTIFANGEPVDKIDIGNSFLTHTVSLPAFSSGQVKLRLRAEGPPGEISVSRIGLNRNE